MKNYSYISPSNCCCVSLVSTTPAPPPPPPTSFSLIIHAYNLILKLGSIDIIIIMVLIVRRISLPNVVSLYIYVLQLLLSNKT